jgi:hypothetical protein
LLDVNSNDSKDLQRVSQRVWYQKRVRGYGVCFVKVKITMQTDKNITVRVSKFRRNQCKHHKCDSRYSGGNIYFSHQPFALSINVAEQSMNMHRLDNTTLQGSTLIRNTRAQSNHLVRRL